MSTLLWLVASIVGLAICANTTRDLWAKRADLPVIGTADGTRAQLIAGRDVAQLWTRLAFNVGGGAFCVLVTAGALLQMAASGPVNLIVGLMVTAIIGAVSAVALLRRP
jgi:hypothetical protein